MERLRVELDMAEHDRERIRITAEADAAHIQRLTADLAAVQSDYERVQSELDGSLRGDERVQSLQEEVQRLKLDYKKVQSRLAEAESGDKRVHDDLLAAQSEKGRLLTELQGLQQAVLECRRENKTLVSERNSSPLPPPPKAVETTLDPDGARAARLMELQQRHDELQRTMREKDRLLDDAYKEKILLARGARKGAAQEVPSACRCTSGSGVS